MALLSDMLLAVRRDIHDLVKPGEQNVDVDPTAVTYAIPTLGPIQSGTLTLDVDGTVQAPAAFTFYESGSVVFGSIPSGTNIHATFQWSRWSDKDLTQFVQEAIREFSLDFPKFNTRFRTPAVGAGVLTTTLTSPYSKGDGQFVVASTSGWDPQGLVIIGNNTYFYNSTDATHFLGLQIWVGPDANFASGTTLKMDDNQNHGWMFDPTVVRYVYTVEGFEPSDEFGVGMGYQDIAYWDYDVFTGYLNIQFDFSQLTIGNVTPIAPQDQFKVRTGEYYAVPVNATDVLQTPDYAFNPISWLASALAIESRESDRDLAYSEKSGLDVQGDPTGTFVKTGTSFRKKYTDWVKTNFRSAYFPRSRRKMYQL